MPILPSSGWILTLQLLWREGKIICTAAFQRAMNHTKTNHVFSSNWLWCLNWFCSWFLEPWCCLVNQSVFPPVLNRIMVIKDTPSTEDIVQYTGTCGIWHVNCSSHGKPTISRFQHGTHFLGSIPTKLQSKVKNGTIGMQTGAGPVPCLWKQAEWGNKTKCKHN